MRYLSTLAIAPVLLSGCSTDEGPQSSVTDQTDTSSQTYDYQKHLAEAAGYYGIEDPPVVDPIREITPAESAQVFDSCMSDKGWTEASQGGFTFPEDQEDSFNLDSYVCEVSYPIMAEMTTALSDDQWRLVYSYRTDVFMVCAETNGFDFPEPPTIDVFLADPGGWDPVADIEEQLVAAVGDGTYSSLDDFYNACPPAPPEDELRP